MDRKWKFFQRKEPSLPLQPAVLTRLPWAYEHAIREGGPEVRKQRQASVGEITQKLLLENFTPPCVIVNEKGDVLYVHGRTGRYLEPAPGHANLNVLEMAREGIAYELRSALHNAVAHQKEIVSRDLRVKTNGELHAINLMVRPIAEPEALKGLLMVIFEEIRPKKEAQVMAQAKTVSKRGRRVQELEQELRYSKESLQATIEELQASNEELKSTNEELQSTNEELQSTNEELTTSKEELQSLNEELMTVNAELQGKNDELALTNNDMRNLLNSTQIPTVFLDNSLRIKRYTNPATAIFTLIPGDIGRPVTDIKSHLRDGDLMEDIRGVLDTLIFKEKQVHADDGKWYIMRIMPYRTMENLIDGVVITFSDISDIKKLAQVLKEREQLCILAGIVRESDAAILVHDRNGTIQAWNIGAEHLFGWLEADVLGKNARELVPADDQPTYDAAVKRIWDGKKITSFRTRRITKTGIVIDVDCSVKALKDEEGNLISVATTEVPVKGGQKRKKDGRT